MIVALLIALIVLNGMLAMAELALVAARKNRLEQLAERGDRSSAIALKLAKDPTGFLSTIQIGITAIAILNGIVGEAAFSAQLAEWLIGMGLSDDTGSLVATVGVVAIITYLTIVVGELVPKRLAQRNAETIARIVARPIAILAVVSRPAVWVLSISTNTILKLFGRASAGGGESVTEDDIEAMIDQGTKTGVINKEEQTIVRNVFRLDDRQLASLMTPRNEIIALDLSLPFENQIERLIDSGFSRFPVYQDGWRNLLGVITAKQILRMHVHDTIAESLEDELIPPVYVPETLTGLRLLQQLRESRAHFAFVVDEHGDVEGILTLQDLLEALAGRFPEDETVSYWASLRTDGTWMLRGLIALQELRDTINISSIPEGEGVHFHTLSGLIMTQLGKVPKIGEGIDWEGWRFEVVKLNGNRIERVRARILTDTQTSDGDIGQT